MKKRLLSMIMAIFMLFSVLGEYTVYADNECMLIVTCDNISNGYVNAKVSIKNNPGVAGVAFLINFDNSKLTPVSVSKSNTLGGSPVSNVDQGGDLSLLNFVSYQWHNPSNIAKDGELISIKFSVKSGDWEETELTPTYLVGDIVNEKLEDVNVKIITTTVGLPAVDFIFEDCSYVYDGNSKEIKASSLPSGAKISYENNVGKNAGIYNAIATVTMPGHKKTVKAATLKISPKTVSITDIKTENKIYDGTNIINLSGGTVNGIISGDDAKVNIPSKGKAETVNSGANINVVLENVLIEGNSKENYILKQPENLKVDILKAPITVKADNKQKIKGEKDPSLTYTYTGQIYQNDSFVGSLSRVEGEDIGKYDIIQGSLTLGSNYDIIYNKGILEITDKIPQNIVVKDIGDKTYGDDEFSLEITKDPISNLSEFSFESSNPYVAEIDSTGKIKIKGCGKVEIKVIEAGNEDYSRTEIVKLMTVNKKSLTVKVDDITITYGDEIHPIISYDGFVYGEDESVLSKAVTASGISGRPSVGTHDIILHGAQADNYNINYINSKLYVNEREIAIVELGVFAKVYDGNTQATINTSTLRFDNLIIGDDVSIDLSKVKTEFATKDIGVSIPVTMSGISLKGTCSANYKLKDDVFFTIGEIMENINSSIIASQIKPFLISRDLTELVLPNIPDGFKLILKSSNAKDIISNEGKISPVLNNTNVEIILTVINIKDNTDVCDTVPLLITIPASTKIYIEVTASGNGTVKGTGQYLKNAKAIIEATPDRGYLFDGWYEDNINVSSDMKYSFIAVNDRNIVAKFKIQSVIDDDEDDEWISDKDKNDNSSTEANKGNDKKFYKPSIEEQEKNNIVYEKMADVKMHWANESIKYVMLRGLFVGTQENKFEPDNAVTRAMVVTVLHRLMGEPDFGNISFSDVDSNSWYAKSIAWASSESIVSGFEDDTFDPNKFVTREQLCVMLYNLTKTLNVDISSLVSLNNFRDSQNVSVWARDAVEWAVSYGLINGKPEKILDPKGTATRAEISAILNRFINLFEE